MTVIETITVPQRPMLRFWNAASVVINAKASVRLVNSKSNRGKLDAAIALLEETRDELQRDLLELEREKQ